MQNQCEESEGDLGKRIEESERGSRIEVAGGGKKVEKWQGF